MDIERRQADILQQLGVSYPQLIDYTSKEYAAILVQIGLLVMMIWDCIITFDGEMESFWQAKRKVRWSPARVLFMLNRYLPVVVYSILAYWRVNRSLDNPLCTIRGSVGIILAPIYTTTAILQALRVWSLYNRSRRVGQFLAALVACEILGTVLAKIFPTPEGLPMARLAPESLTGCGPEQPKGLFTCTSALIMETIFLTMIIIKVYQSWVHVGPMPLFRALVLDGATYYLLFIIIFSLAMVANANDVLYYPIVDTHVAVSMNVVACNHLMLSLRKAAKSPNSGEPPSQSLSVATRPTTDLTFIPQASGVTYSYDDRSETPRPAESAVWNYKQSNPEQKPSEWHEMKSSEDSTARVLLEKD